MKTFLMGAKCVMWTFVVMAVFALLSGCATQMPSVVKVNVPIPVPCKITPVEKPPMAVDALPLDANIWQQMKALRAERLERKAYEEQLEAAEKGCQ